MRRIRAINILKPRDLTNTEPYVIHCPLCQALTCLRFTWCSQELAVCLEVCAADTMASEHSVPQSSAGVAPGHWTSKTESRAQASSDVKTPIISWHNALAWKVLAGAMLETPAQGDVPWRGLDQPGASDTHSGTALQPSLPCPPNQAGKQQSSAVTTPRSAPPGFLTIIRGTQGWCVTHWSLHLHRDPC